MSIEEKAKDYAKDKAIEAINAAIEQAYADGYNDGMRHIENEKLEAIKDGVEYVDLGLPSGKLWSSTYIKDEKGCKGRLTYIEASKLSIPTIDDYKELCRECKPSYCNQKDCHGIILTGINGNFITIEYTNSEGGAWSMGETFSFRFWLKEVEEEKIKEKPLLLELMEINRYLCSLIFLWV